MLSLHQWPAVSQKKAPRPLQPHGEEENKALAKITTFWLRSPISRGDRRSGEAALEHLLLLQLLLGLLETRYSEAAWAASLSAGSLAVSQHPYKFLTKKMKYFKDSVLHTPALQYLVSWSIPAPWSVLAAASAPADC